MNEKLTIVGTKGWTGRILVAGLIVFSIVFAWFSIKWQIANMFGALSKPNDPNARSVAEFSESLSPNDPLTKWLRASVERETFSSQNLENAARLLEETVRLAPYDFRYWLELGRIYEQSEKFDRAELAFARARVLAPNYSSVNWYVGNFYLRRGRETEAFENLRRAAETSLMYREQVFLVVWEYYEKDFAKMEQLAANQPDIRAGLAKFYAAKEIPDESLRIWNTLSAENKQRNIAIAKIVAQALFDKRSYRSAVEFVRETDMEPDARAEQIQNGGFENPLIADAPAFFGWTYAKRERIDFGTDLTKRKDGGKSIRLVFNNFARTEIKNLQQIVAIQAGARYRVAFWIKTDDLRSAGTPIVEIVNANDEKIVASTPPFPQGTADWNRVAIDFTAPQNAQAVVLRLDRAYCGDTCPISGTVWFDEFSIERAGQ